MKNVYRWLAGWMAALCLLTALAAPVSAEGFDYTWDQDTENNPGGPHCKAYLMLNLDTDTVVYSDNADEQLPMASLTKIMTYIVAYENIPDIENAQITIPQSVVDELSGTGSSVATFDVGETYTGLDMLYLMMVPSGNNAALTLAKYVDQLYTQGQITGGNVANAGDDPEATTSGTDSSSGELAPAYGEEGFDGSDYTGRSYFVDLMNQKAQELGCVNTHFTNPHGLHNENHYSTARDMVTIAKYAMSLPHFTEITGTTYYEYHPVDEPDNIRACSTTNRMLTNSLGNDGYNYYYTYATGIKTGSHDQAGYCILASASAYGYTYVVCCLGCPSVDSDLHGEMLDAASLFRWALTQLESKTIAAQGDILTEVTLDYAWQKDTLQLVAKDNVSVMLPKSVDLSSIIVTVDVPESVQAPVERGQEVGTATMSYAGETIATVTLVAAESVARSEMLQFISQGTSVLTSPWFLIIMGIILLLIIVYIILILLYRRKQKQLRRVRKYRDL